MLIPGLSDFLNQVDVTGDIIVMVIPTVPGILPCLVSARYTLLLKIALIVYNYYLIFDQDFTQYNINYNTVLQPFMLNWKTIEVVTAENKPSVPLLHKNTNCLRWIDYFDNCLYKTFGVRQMSLSYVIRTKVTPIQEVEDSLAIIVCGEVAGILLYDRSATVLSKLILCLTHEILLYNTYDTMIYLILKEATRRLVYTSMVKPYGQRKDGREDWLSMLSLYALERQMRAAQERNNIFYH